MAITYVGAASAAGTSLTLPTHQKGDFLICAAFTSGATAPTVPTGWLSMRVLSAASRRMAIGFRSATAAGTASGTWTNATVIASAVYRSNASLYIGPVNNTGSTSASTSIAYSAIASFTSIGSSWVVAIAGGSIDGSSETAPTGTVSRTSIFSTNEIAIHDSDGVASSWSTQNVATTSMSWASLVCEIAELDISIASGSGLILPRPMNGGYSA